MEFHINKLVKNFPSYFSFEMTHRQKQDVNEWYDDDGRRDRKIRCDFLAFFLLASFMDRVGIYYIEMM